MNISNDQIDKIIGQLKSADQSNAEGIQMLKELKEPEEWEPKKYLPNFSIEQTGRITKWSRKNSNAVRLYGNEFPTEQLAQVARDMNKRNQLILQAKTELEERLGRKIDGGYEIHIGVGENQGSLWRSAYVFKTANPELTFENQSQAEQVIKMVGLNKKEE